MLLPASSRIRVVIRDDKFERIRGAYKATTPISIGHSVSNGGPICRFKSFRYARSVGAGTLSVLLEQARLLVPEGSTATLRRQQLALNRRCADDTKADDPEGPPRSWKKIQQFSA
jgi:hypothetical protein